MKKERAVMMVCCAFTFGCTITLALKGDLISLIPAALSLLAFILNAQD